MFPDIGPVIYGLTFKMRNIFSVGERRAVKCFYPILLGSLQPVPTKSTHPAEFAEACILVLVGTFWQIKD